MEGEKSAHCPPPYVVTGLTSSEQQPPRSQPRKSKVLFGYAVAMTTALVVVLVIGGIYYFKTVDTLQKTILKFHLSDDRLDSRNIKDVEIDQSNNIVVFQLSGPGFEPGSFSVLDYTRSMLGIYDPGQRSCYLIGGIKNTFPDLLSLGEHYQQNATAPASGRKIFYYSVADDYPISDKSILPSPLINACASLPTYWLEPDQAMANNRRKRLADAHREACCCHNECVAIDSGSDN